MNGQISTDHDFFVKLHKPETAMTSGNLPSLLVPRSRHLSQNVLWSSLDFKIVLVYNNTTIFLTSAKTGIEKLYCIKNKFSEVIYNYI